MKKITSLLCSLLILSAGTAYGCGVSEKDYPVYLIIGQSNASGNGRIADLPAAYLEKEYENVDIYCAGTANGTVNGKLLKVSTKEGQGSISTARFGTEVGIAEYFTQKKYKAGIIKCGFDGASINLKNTNYGTWWISDDDIPENVKPRCYTEFLAAVDAGLTAFKNAGLNPVIKGAIWLQGESNAEDKTYENDLDALIAKIRKDLSVPDLYFVAGTICYETYTGKYAKDCAVNVAIRKLKDKQNCDYIESGKYPTNMNDRYHWTGSALTDIGMLAAMKLYTRFGK